MYIPHVYLFYTRNFLAETKYVMGDSPLSMMINDLMQGYGGALHGIL